MRTMKRYVDALEPVVGPNGGRIAWSNGERFVAGFCPLAGRVGAVSGSSRAWPRRLDAATDRRAVTPGCGMGVQAAACMAGLCETMTRC